MITTYDKIRVPIQLDTDKFFNDATSTPPPPPNNDRVGDDASVSSKTISSNEKVPEEPFPAEVYEGLI